MPARVSPARRSGAHKSPKEREAGQAQQHLHETAQDGGQHGQGAEHGWLVTPAVRRSKSRVGAARRPPGGRRIPTPGGDGGRAGTCLGRVRGEPRDGASERGRPRVARVRFARRPGGERSAGGDRTVCILGHKPLFGRAIDTPRTPCRESAEATASKAKKAIDAHKRRGNRT